MTQPNYLAGGASSLAHHWSEIFLQIRHQFHTSILLSNWTSTNQQTSIWNLGSDAYFEYTSCYFKVVTLIVRNLFRVRLPYLLLIRRLLFKSLIGIKYFFNLLIPQPHIHRLPACRHGTRAAALCWVEASLGATVLSFFVVPGWNLYVNLVFFVH
jgi:hypothetical protein